MGLSIHYSGKIRNKASLPDLIEEVKDIANTHQWNVSAFHQKFAPHSTFDQAIDGKLYGVVFSPPNCEPAWLSFLSNGKMSSPVALKLFGEQRDEKEEKYLYQLSTKTQFAGAQIHQMVIHLIRYLSEKYLDDFTLIDEGQYWETGDENTLKETFNRYTLLLDVVEDGFKNLPMKSGESMEAYFERMTKNLRKRGGQK